jgi:hypothetical protein
VALLLGMRLAARTRVSQTLRLGKD